MQTPALKAGLKLASLCLVAAGASASMAGDLYYLGLPNTTHQQAEKPGFKATLGYQLNPNFAVESAYADATSSGLNLAGLGIIPMSDQLSLFGKVGYTVAGVRPVSSLGGLSLTASPEKSSMGMGLGGIYQISPKIGLRAEYEKLDSDVNHISFGLQAKF
jgi:opacity protein-like surface antigen